MNMFERKRASAGEFVREVRVVPLQEFLAVPSGMIGSSISDIDSGSNAGAPLSRT